MRKHKKRIPKSIKSIYSLLILISCIFMSVGYASLSAIDLLIQGDALTTIPREVFIVDAKYLQRSNSLASETATITSLYNQTLISEIILEPNVQTSQVSVIVTLYNNTDATHRLKDITYSSDVLGAYSNSNIEYTFDNKNAAILPYETLDVTLTFKYITDANLTQNKLSSILHFEIEQISYIRELIKLEALSNSGYAVKYNKADASSFANDVYYYTNGAQNINVLFGGFCWELLRTTETGGTKMIYNGIPTSEGSCNNTETTPYIGRGKYNTSPKSPAYVGYMYNKVYTQKIFEYTKTNTLYTKTSVSSTMEYYYASSYTYDETYYTLKNTNNEEVNTYLWSSNYSTLSGQYRCKNGAETTCTELYYIVDTDSQNAYTLSLTSGKSIEDLNSSIVLSSNYEITADGSYALSSTTTIDKLDWHSNYAIYKGYYMCEDTQSTTCTNLIYISDTTNNTFTYNSNSNNHIFGNTFQYDSSTNEYTLINTISIWEWGKGYNQINNNHYTCFNKSGKCTNIGYVYITNAKQAVYIELENGKNINDALTEMLSSSETNKINSTIKDAVDNWYASNLTSYTKYLEDTIYCNDRSISSYSGWSPNGGSTTSNLTFASYHKNLLTCSNESDRFTVDSSIGNGALTYPVAVIELQEAKLRGDIQNANKSTYWTLSPYDYRAANQQVFGVFVDQTGKLITYAGVDGVTGYRPVVSLKPEIEYIEGNGSLETPYKILEN